MSTNKLQYTMTELCPACQEKSKTPSLISVRVVRIDTITNQRTGVSFIRFYYACEHITPKTNAKAERP